MRVCADCRPAIDFSVRAFSGPSGIAPPIVRPSSDARHVRLFLEVWLFGLGRGRGSRATCVFRPFDAARFIIFVLSTAVALHHATVAPFLCRVRELPCRLLKNWRVNDDTIFMGGRRVLG